MIIIKKHPDTGTTRTVIPMMTPMMTPMTILTKAMTLMMTGITSTPAIEVDLSEVRITKEDYPVTDKALREILRKILV